EIRKRGAASVFIGREVWYHGRAGFYDIERVSPRRQTLYGLTVYQLDEEFQFRRVVEAESAVWDGTRWQLNGARTVEFGPEGPRRPPPDARGAAELHAARDARGFSRRRGRSGGAQLRHAAATDEGPPPQGRRHLGERGRPPSEAGAPRGEPGDDAPRGAARRGRQPADEPREQPRAGVRGRVQLLRPRRFRPRPRTERRPPAGPRRLGGERALRAGGRLLSPRRRVSLQVREAL